MVDGKTTIAPEVLQSIARLTALNVPGVSSIFTSTAGVERLFKRKINEGVQIDVIDDTVYANIHLVMYHDVNVIEVGRTIQQEVARAISEMVGMQIGYVDVHVEDIDYPKEQET